MSQEFSEWRVAPSGLSVVDGQFDAEFPNGRPVAVTSPLQKLGHRAEIARLIAVAPGMLSLLEEAIPELKATADAYGTEVDCGLRSLILRIEAAVAKAKGE